jgi:hypothetical protein
MDRRVQRSGMEVAGFCCAGQATAAAPGMCASVQMGLVLLE